MSLGFRAVSGSIVGTEHVRLHRNNQDGLGLFEDEDLLVAVVTDGCSQGRSSEVGARLGASWLAQWTPTYWRTMNEDAEAFLEALSHGLTSYLARVVAPMKEEVGDFLLFTYLLAVVDTKRTIIGGVGDGVFSVNQRSTVLDAGPENAPPYLAYRLVSADPSATTPVVHFEGRTSEVASLVIATDGAIDLARETQRAKSVSAGIEQFETDPRYLKNPSLLGKRLVVLGVNEGRLRDDTSMVLIRREPRRTELRCTS